ncbi:MAG: DUF760 domain-containing protein [Cyanobacteria bacterium P01_G01_bin.67]
MKSENSPQNTFRYSEEDNSLWHYVKSLSPETIAQLSQPESQEVFQIIEHNITGLLGNMPSESFDVEISTDRENLGRLLASAMMSGYFLRNAEQRMGFEASWLRTSTDH